MNHRVIRAGGLAIGALLLASIVAIGQDDPASTPTIADTCHGSVDPGFHREIEDESDDRGFVATAVDHSNDAGFLEPVESTPQPNGEAPVACVPFATPGTPSTRR